MEPIKKTRPPEWADIPEDIQKYILGFLSPSIALQMITSSKNNLDLHGKYIIQRFQNEKFKYKSIQTEGENTLALMEDGSLCLGT